MFDSNCAAILGGITLVRDLLRLRERRLKGDEPTSLAADLDAWLARRSAWWEEIRETSASGVFVPLAALVERFGLSAREVDCLLIALAPIVDPEFLDQFAHARQSFLFRGVDVELVLGLLFHSKEERFAGRLLLTPDAPLVRHGLLSLVPVGTEINPNETEVRPADALANFVLERPLLSGPLARFCEIVKPAYSWEQIVLPDETRDVVWDLVSGGGPVRTKLDGWGFRAVFLAGRGAVLLFAGPPGTGKTAFSHAIASRLARPLLRIRASRLAATAEPLQPILADAFRVAALTDAVVLMDDCEALLSERNARFLGLLEALDEHDGLLILTTNLATQLDFALARRILYRVDFEVPTPALRELIWEVHLPPEVPLADDIHLPTLASTYEITGAVIRNAVLVALSRMVSQGRERLVMADLRSAVETQLGARFDDLAVRSATTLGLSALVLPTREMMELRDVLSACRHHEDVLARWGFGRRLTRGRGVCILFDGPPGTGETFAAELLSAELRLPLFRIHIPQIVSKWVGETERNIVEIFVRARAGRAILLFDEADALFGRRSSGGQGATDRYANMEVNLLLQEIERYDGITVLTTNLYGNLDEALQRRVQYRVSFPFPEVQERTRIWSVLMPPEALLAPDVDFGELGRRFELSGGHIKNAILRAAYRARDEGDRIFQRHLVDASIAECRAQGKLVREDPVPKGRSGIQQTDPPGTVPTVSTARPKDSR